MFSLSLLIFTFRTVLLKDLLFVIFKQMAGCSLARYNINQIGQLNVSTNIELKSSKKENFSVYTELMLNLHLNSIILACCITVLNWHYFAASDLNTLLSVTLLSHAQPELSGTL